MTDPQVQERFALVHEPYDAATNAALARIAGIGAPVTESIVTLLSTLYARDFRAENPLLEALRLAAETPAGLLARCAGRTN